MKKLIIAITLILNSACSNNAIPRLPLPIIEDLPALYDGELQCISDLAYKNVVWRDVIYKQHIEKLEAVIKATHK